MADGFIRVPADDAGKRVDSEELTVSGLTVQRQRVRIGGLADTAIAPVDATAGLKVDLGADNDVTVASLPLPTGAATAAAQLADGHNVTVDNASIAVTAASLPLPTGAATAAAQLADGHAVTVDNTTGSPANVQLGDGTLQATVRDTGASDSLNVAIVDASGNQITSFGGSGGTSHSDDAAFSIGGASSITPMGALADETTPDSVDEGDAGLVRMTLDRKLLTRVVGATDANRLDIDASGHAQVDIAASSATVTVDGSGVTQPVSAASLPLPTGAATSAAQLPDGHAVTVDNASIAVTAASLPLPTGAATAAAQLADGHNVTVDNTTGAPANVQIGDGTLQASVRNTGTSDSLNVSIVDAAGTQITSFGGSGGTAETDNTAFTGGATSHTPMGAIFDGTPPAITDGNMGTPRMSSTRDMHSLLVTDDGTSAGDDANNAIRVNVVAGSAGGPSAVDDAAFAVAVDSVAPMGAMADEVTPDVVDEGDVGIPRMTLDRKILTRVVGATDGNRLDVDASGHAQVDIAASSATVAVSAVSLPLPAGAATAALQLANGHDVTIDNAAGASAVNIQDGGNVISVDAAALPLPAGAATSALQLADGHNVATVADATDAAAHGASQTGFRAMGSDGTNDQQISVDAAGVVDVAAAALPLPAGAATAALQLANGHDVTIDNAAGASAVNIQDGGNVISIDAAALPLPAGAATSAAQLADGHGVAAEGAVLHDTADTGEAPVKVGHKVVEFGADPPVVNADNDVTDSVAAPQGMQLTLGGHPNVITREYMTTDGTTRAVVPAVGATDKIVVLGVDVMVSNATTVNPAVRLGFGATAIPTEPTTGNTIAGMLLAHPGLAPGSGISKGNGGGILAVGGEGEEVYIENDAPTTGQIQVMLTYYVSTL